MVELCRHRNAEDDEGIVYIYIYIYLRETLLKLAINGSALSGTSAHVNQKWPAKPCNQ